MTLAEAASSTCRPPSAQVEADYNTAKLQADRDAALAKEGLFSEVDAKISAVKAQQLGNRLQTRKEAHGHQRASRRRRSWPRRRSRWTSCAADYNLKKSQVDQLKVRAGFDGMLQQLPHARWKKGQKVAAGTPLGKVAQPSQAEGRTEDRRNTGKRCRDRSARGDRYA